MKHSIFKFLVFSLLLFSACSDNENTTDPIAQDPCEMVSCGEGTCDNGTCNCDMGYEKDTDGACTIPWASNFVATDIEATDLCDQNSVNAGSFIYNLDISMEDATTLSTLNLFGYGSGNIIEIEVTGPDTIEIDFTDAANRVFVGSGTLTDGVLTINYTATFPNNGGMDTCVTTISYNTTAE